MNETRVQHERSCSQSSLLVDISMRHAMILCFSAHLQIERYTSSDIWVVVYSTVRGLPDDVLQDRNVKADRSRLV
jgi:hypothetical protein